MVAQRKLRLKVRYLSSSTNHYAANSSSNALASFKSSVSKPSVNQRVSAENLKLK
jgi:hypothetical protein